MCRRTASLHVCTHLRRIAGLLVREQVVDLLVRPIRVRVELDHVVELEGLVDGAALVAAGQRDQWDVERVAEDRPDDSGETIPFGRV